MIDASLFLFVPTLMAMVCLFTRRNFFCLFMGMMVWLQSVVVTAAWRPLFRGEQREQISFVCLMLVILCFAGILRFAIRKNRGGRG
jgi:hypothetical protein